MREIKDIRYVADDGKKFDTKEACINYENTVLNHRKLIDYFNIFDSELHRLEKPKYLWSCDPKELKKELKQDPILKDFDFTKINEDAQYIVFNKKISDYQYKKIRDSFGFLSNIICMGDFTFPYELERANIIYYTGYEWANFDCALKLARETFDIYDRLKL